VLQKKEAQLMLSLVLSASELPQEATGKASQLLQRGNPNELFFLLELLTKVRLILIPRAKSFTTSISELLNHELFV
jgi:hypothetical protein